MGSCDHQRAGTLSENARNEILENVVLEVVDIMISADMSFSCITQHVAQSAFLQAFSKSQRSALKWECSAVCPDQRWIGRSRHDVWGSME